GSRRPGTPAASAEAADGPYLGSLGFAADKYRQQVSSSCGRVYRSAAASGVEVAGSRWGREGGGPRRARREVRTSDASTSSWVRAPATAGITPVVAISMRPTLSAI